MEVILKKKSKTFEEEATEENRIRVVAYARVSTETERQQGSFESQKSYYYEKISNNPDWIFKGIYADEGISGTTSEDRTGFRNMIRDAKLKKFDLILTKSISRFARNTVDTLKFIRFLKEKNVSVFFEEENINTNALQGELLLTILGSLAQQESENTSSHILAGKEMALKNGTRKVWSACYGYDYNQKTRELTINDDAKNVKKIFELYLECESIRQVIEELHKQKIKSPSGQEIWTNNGITNILTNEKYIGNVVFGNYYVCNSLGHKTKRNEGERAKYRYYNHHESIISKELFDKVNKKYQLNKQRDYNWRNKSGMYNLMSWRGICGFCGYSLSKKTSHRSDNPYYKCRNAIKRVTRELCPNSKILKTCDIESSFLKGMRKIRNKINLNTLDDEIESKLSYVRNLIINANLDKFNYELYEKIVNLVIMGGYDETGRENPYLLRFILKEDLIFDNKYKNKRRFNGKTIEILSFDNKINAKYGVYDDDRNYSKLIIDSIKVKIELQDDDSLIWKL